MLFAICSVYGEKLRSNDNTAVLRFIEYREQDWQGNGMHTMHVKQLR